MNRTATQIVDKLVALEKRVAQLEQNSTVALEARVAELTGVTSSILDQLVLLNENNQWPAMTNARKEKKQ